jgi:alpha-maltose-1-phosphate synthase
MTIKVLMITSEYPPVLLGGLGTHVFELTEGLRRLGCDITVVAPTKGETAHHVDTNLSVHYVSMADSLNQTSLVKAVVHSNRDCLRYGLDLIPTLKTRPDVIHCHDWLSFPAAQQLGRRFDIPVVGTVHLLYSSNKLWGESIDREIFRIEKELCQQPEAVITVSESMRSLIRVTHGTAANKIHVVHNGMSPGLYSEAAANHAETSRLKQLYATDGKKIILFAGRLAPQKGVSALFESASAVIEKDERAHYLIAGTHPWSSGVEISKYHRKHYPQYPKLWDKVEFLDLIPRAHLAQLYQIADVAVVPSIYEPFGYAALEAMAAGVPVVATRTGGLAEIVVDGETGLLVPLNPNHRGEYKLDIEALTEAQLFFLRNDVAARRMGAAGQRRASTEFSQEKMVASVKAVYSEVIAGQLQIHPGTSRRARLENMSNPAIL